MKTGHYFLTAQEYNRNRQTSQRITTADWRL